MKRMVVVLVSLLVLLLVLANGQSSGTAQVSPDPDLQSGFPIQTMHLAGSYHAGPVIHTLVADLGCADGPVLVATGIGQGPLYAWEADSALLSGWPTADKDDMVYPAAGEVSGSSCGLELLANHWDGGGDTLAIYDRSGRSLPGWPQGDHNPWEPVALADVDGDGLDEIFDGPGDDCLHAVKGDGSALPGWPACEISGAHTRHLPAIADLDGDGDLEIVSATDSVSPGGVSLYAYHHTGEPVIGFPVQLNGCTDTFPVIGDVDGDGEAEIVAVECESRLAVFAGSGVRKMTLQLSGGLFYGNQPALADLDGDGWPEMIVVTNSHLNVFRGDGSALPGWPQALGEVQYWVGNTSPVVGDVDGDQIQEIIVTLQVAGQDVNGELRIYEPDGTQNSHSPKLLPLGSGAVPAIDDIDRDGRNEIVVSGSYWNGTKGWFDKLWVFDLGGPPHGRVEWAQFGGGPHHRGAYPVPPSTQYNPNPVPCLGHCVYLPFVSKPPAPPTLHGRVTVDGQAAANVPLDLRFYDGGAWSTLMHTVTGGDGGYSFAGLPSLGAGQSYSVRNQNVNPGNSQLSQWSTRAVSTYWEGDPVGMSEFDLSDVGLVAPAPGATVTIPVSFEWITRTTSPWDLYSLVIYDPVDGDPSGASEPIRGAYGFDLWEMPTFFEYDTPYAWTVWVFSQEGAMGQAGEVREITFTPGAFRAPVTSTIQLEPLNWDAFRDLPCSRYGFVDACQTGP